MRDIKPDIGFQDWLKQYIEISDFARLVVEDKKFPDTTKWEVVEEYLLTTKMGEKLYFRFFQVFLYYIAYYDPKEQERMVRCYIKEIFRTLPD